MKLKNLFKKDAPLLMKAVRICAAAVCGLFILVNALPRMIPARGLTAGEKTTLKEIFKDSVDYNKIRIARSPASDWYLRVRKLDAETYGNKIIYSSKSYYDDFSVRDGDLNRQNGLIHEVTHVWQNQNWRSPFWPDLKIAFTTAQRSNRDASYEYQLERGKDLLDYNAEQQAGIIADFNTFVLQGMISMEQQPQKSRSINFEMCGYTDVLHNFISNPSYPRQK